MSALSSTCLRTGFTGIQDVIPICEKIKKLSAICKLCANSANYTFRTAGKTVTDVNQPQVGGAESYMPLCRECWNVKTAEQNEKLLKPTTQVLYSESGSTAFNESDQDKSDPPLLDMEPVNNSASAKMGSPMVKVARPNSNSPKQEGTKLST